MSGPVVRVGPKMIFVNDPESFTQIYRWNRARSLQALFGPMKLQSLPGDIEMKVHDKRKHAFKQPVSPLQT